MQKYYTRACNFYYNNKAKLLIKKKLGLPLCGRNDIAFNQIEIFKRKKNKVESKTIGLNDVKNLKGKLKNKVKKDIKKITSKRKKYLKGLQFNLPSIMGILNLTPDSFSDGGKFNKKKNSDKHIKEMIKSGAEIIDVGGESTRPGSKTVPLNQEWNRIKYIITNFKKKYKKTYLSIDTRKSEIMIKSIKHRADIINDVSGYSFDNQALKKIKNENVIKVLHHMQGTPATMQLKPRYRNVLLDIYDYFEENIKKINSKKIIIDPGIGFGKSLKHNLTLISKISLFHSLGFPILVGTSRKRFINQISGVYDSEDRTGGTLASVLFLLSQGVQIFRVHNVKEVKQGVLVFKRLISE